jgi:16S rRNA (adenine1518-N6/adenine1519-N6)-dimethyltransferase
LLTNKEKYEKYKPKKFLGQNFLVDDNIARKIIKALEIEEGDNVLEIGPGQGALTKHLVNYNCRYAAVELDKGIAEDLSEQYEGRLKVVHSDFLKVNLEKDFKDYFDSRKRIKIIGNIPYNITSEILFKLFESREHVDRAVIMMQKEVAHRLAAKPDTKDYGILAINTQVNSTPRLLFNVPATAFFPKPRVESTVVLLTFAPGPSAIENMQLFKRLVKESFGKRRKVMSNSLKDMFEELNISFKCVNFDFSRRPENVTILEFTELANNIRLMADAKESTDKLIEGGNE